MRGQEHGFNALLKQLDLVCVQGVDGSVADVVIDEIFGSLVCMYFKPEIVFRIVKTAIGFEKKISKKRFKGDFEIFFVMLLAADLAWASKTSRRHWQSQISKNSFSDVL